MSVRNRLRWERGGRAYTLMRPARDLRDVLRGHGYTVYDLGDRRHLEHDPPEDHTPYSATGYPGRARYGVGYAIDIMPPDDPALPSLQRLGAQLLADRRAGVPGISWLKYMNWEPEGDNTGPCHQDSWKGRYARRRSGDRGHIHLSGLTGFEESTTGAGYDPVARLRGKDDDMPTPKDVWLTDGLVEAPDTREDKTNTHWTPAAVLNDADNNARAARVAAERAAAAADRAANAAERAATAAEKAAAGKATGGQAPVIDYDELARALLRTMADPRG